MCHQLLFEMANKVPDVSVFDLPTGGYKDQIFLDLPPESLHCPVCLLVVREPHVLVCCGTHICQVSIIINGLIQN